MRSLLGVPSWPGSARGTVSVETEVVTKALPALAEDRALWWKLGTMSETTGMRMTGSEPRLGAEVRGSDGRQCLGMTPGGHRLEVTYW